MHFFFFGEAKWSPSFSETVVAMWTEVLWVWFNQAANGRMEELDHTCTYAHALLNCSITKL